MQSPAGLATKTVRCQRPPAAERLRFAQPVVPASAGTTLMDYFVVSAFRLRSASFGGRSRSLSYGGRVASPQGAVIVRLDRTIQYASASQFILRRLWNTGSRAGACHRAARRADPAAGMTTWFIDATPHSRGAMRPSCACILRLQNRGRRKTPGARRTRGLVCKV
jgi:hypothetical protein